MFVGDVTVVLATRGYRGTKSHETRRDQTLASGTSRRLDRLADDYSRDTGFQWSKRWATNKLRMHVTLLDIEKSELKRV